MNHNYPADNQEPEGREYGGKRAMCMECAEMIDYEVTEVFMGHVVLEGHCPEHGKQRITEDKRV